MKPSFTRIKLITIVVLIFAIYLIPWSSNAQSQDSLSITQAIDNYIIGWRTGNSDLLTKAFDTDAGVILWVDRSEESEKLKSMKLADLANREKTQEGYGVGYTVESLKIIDSKIAVATVKIPARKGHYIDILELQKINEDWKIVLKSFVYFKKE